MEGNLHELDPIEEEEYENEGSLKLAMVLLRKKLSRFKILPLMRFQMKKAHKTMHIWESLGRRLSVV
jgi:hypothetical protein